MNELLLHSYLQTLKLPTMLREYPTVARQCAEAELGYEEFLDPTLDDEGAYIGPKTVVKGNHLLELEKGNYVVLGAFGNYRSAEEYSDQLFIKGIRTKFGYISQTKIYYVYVFVSEIYREAQTVSNQHKKLKIKFKENWILRVQ